MRFCPQCSLILEAAEWNGAPIHACRSCGGVWMAGVDFARLLEVGAGFSELDSLFPSSVSAGMFEGLPKPCPDCRSTQLGRPEPVTGEPNPRTCPQCRGVWLEAGEPGLRGMPEREPVNEPLNEPLNEPAREAATADAMPYEPDIAVPVAEPAPPPIVEVQAEKPPELTEALPETKASPEIPAPWLPPVSATMPDPRPMSRRGGPLTQEAAEETAAIRPQYQARRWCPQCLRGYRVEVIECPRCGVGVVESSYRIRCPQCRSENSIGADVCWRCHALLHPEPAGDALAPPPPLPTTADLNRMRKRAENVPPGVPSCSSVLTWLVVGCVAAGLITLLLER